MEDLVEVWWFTVDEEENKVSLEYQLARWLPKLGTRLRRS